MNPSEGWNLRFAVLYGILYPALDRHQPLRDINRDWICHDVWQAQGERWWNLWMPTRRTYGRTPGRNITCATCVIKVSNAPCPAVEKKAYQNTVRIDVLSDRRSQARHGIWASDSDSTIMYIWICAPCVTVWHHVVGVMVGFPLVAFRM